MNRVSRKLFAAAGCAALLAACASTPADYARDPYAATLYTSAESLYRSDRMASLQAPAQYSQTGEPLAVVSYAGIEGARNAHLRYVDAEAEALDGRCERFVRIGQQESLIDIAELCDVPVSSLIEFNPGIANPYYVSADQVVEVPGGAIDASPLSAMAAPLAALYTASEGDSLSKIAYRFNVSETRLLNANPNVTWTDVRPGAQIAIPASDGGAPAYAAYAPAASRPAWQGWSGGAGIGSAAGSGVEGTLSSGGYVVAPKPYQMRPVNAGLASARPDIRPRIALDRGVISPGDAVRISAAGLPPGQDVTIYAGERTDKMTAVATLTADADGVAVDDVVIPTSSQNIGGVLFRATRDDTGETIYSGRIGIIKLQDPND